MKIFGFFVVSLEKTFWQTVELPMIFETSWWWCDVTVFLQSLLSFYSKLLIIDPKSLGLQWVLFWSCFEPIYLHLSGLLNCHMGNNTLHGNQDDVIKWKQFPRYWSFVRGIHRSPVNSPHKGQWRGALMFSLIYAWINCWVNNREADHLRRYRAPYDVTVMPNEDVACNKGSICVRFKTGKRVIVFIFTNSDPKHIAVYENKICEYRTHNDK